MQNCHLWNTREFNKYKEGLKKYLENNKWYHILSYLY
jgi:hypothetical protein